MWFLWLDVETSRSGEAAAGDQDLLNLGLLKFLIDAGCGWDLIALKYNKA